MPEKNTINLSKQVKSELSDLKEKTIKFKQDFSNNLKGACQDSIGRLGQALKDTEERVNTVYPTIEIDYKEVEANYTLTEKMAVACLKQGVNVLNIITLNYFKFKW